MNTIQKFFALTCLVVGCAPVPQEPTVAPTLVTGRIDGGEPIEVKVIGGPRSIDDGWSQQRGSSEVAVPVAEDGSFEIPLEVATPGFFRLIVAGETVEFFLQPEEDTSIEIKIGARERSGLEVRFGGAYAAENKYLREVSILLGNAERDLEGDFVAVFSLEPAEFAARLNSMKEIILAASRELALGTKDSPMLVMERAEVDIDSWIKNLELLYPSIHEQVAGSPADVGPSYFDDVGRGSFDQPMWLSSANFVRFLDFYVDAMSAGDLKFRSRNLPREKLVSRLQAIQALQGSNEIKTYLLEQMFATFRTSYGPKDWGVVLELLVDDEPENPIAAEVRPLLESDLAERKRPNEIRVFRQVGEFSLEAHLFLPDGYQDRTDHAAYLFFHGGGWAIGTPEWGYETCERMAAKGLVAISFEYRVADVHGSGIPAAVDDVRFAIGWARDHAGSHDGGLRIDPDRLVAAGFSAGAHLAAAAAILPAEELRFTDSRPNALVLASASYDFTKGGFFDSMTGGRAEAYSLYHQVGVDLVPTIMFHTVYDHLTPVSEFREFVAKMESLNNDFEYQIFDGVGHFFRDEEARTEMIRLTDEFLIDRGFMER